MTTIVKYEASESITDWANRTLSADELLEFHTAFNLNHAQWLGYQIEQKILTADPIYEDVYVPELNETVSVKVGERTTLAAGVTLQDVTLHESWRPWLDRYMFEVNAPEVTIEE